MMFHQSMSRNQRAKGSKVKNILQVTVLLAVVVWLLYQTKHSYERKPEYDETEYNKLSKRETDKKLSRKVNAGSENVIIIDLHGNNSDETTDNEETGVGEDVFSQNSEENATEVRNDSGESREGKTNSSMEETQPEQQGYVDDNGESHAEGEVNTDVMQEDLRLPSQQDTDNVDQNLNQNEVDNSLYENGGSKGGVAIDGSSTANNQTETGETEEQGSETSETGEHSGDALPVKEQSSSSSASDDQSSKDMSASEEMVEAQESTGSDNKIEEATTNSRSDDASEVESQVVSDSQSEIAGNGSIQAGMTEGHSDDGSTNNPKSVEENNVVMVDSNDVPVGEEGGSLADRTSEGQTNGNGSIEAVATGMRSEGENADLAGSSEEKGRVMSDVNEVPNDKEVQSQMGVSEGVKTDNNSSEEAKADTTDKQISAEKNSEASEKEAGVSQGGNAAHAEVTINNTVEESNYPKSTDKAANSSQVSENENVELPANGEDSVVGGAQSQRISVSNGENSGKNPLEEENSEQSRDLVANSAQDNEQNNSDLTNNEIPSEAVTSREDSASKIDDNNKNVEDAATEPDSKDAATSVSGNNIELSSGNGSAEGQEGSTSSESSTSGFEENLKGPAEQ